MFAGGKLGRRFRSRSEHK